MKLSKVAVSAGIIILFHLVGLIGFFIPALNLLFLKLVPFHLLLMLLVVVINHYRPDAKFWSFALLIAIIGIAAEWIGVHKHWIFGDYTYGTTLGTKIFDIPLMIGVNWFLLVYATGVMMKRSRLKSLTARIIVGALILVLLDVLIEPVAIRFDYWIWAGGGLPTIKNYWGWLMLSALLLGLFECFKFKLQSMVAPILLVVQFVFFALLQWA